MGSNPEPTPPPPGFRIIPCTGVDLSLRREMAPMGLVINARLDPSRMETTLWTLMEHKFPRAGSRVACRNGVYELQIPETFDSQNPPFVFTVRNHPGLYQRDGRPELPLGLTGLKPCMIPDPELACLFQTPTCPRSLDDFIQSNVPSVHIHITVFDDFTFLGFIAPHIVIDGIGIATLLHAWTELLRGDDIDTIQGMEWDAQPLAPFSSGPVTSDAPRGFLRPSAAALGSQKVQESMKDESDAKDVPPLRACAEGSAEYVGSGDVLSAWWFKTIYGDRRLTDHTPIHIHMVKNLRGMPIFANDAPLAEPYINNLILTIPIPPIPASAFQTESLAAVALRIRRTILAYNNDLEAVRADLRWRCAGSGSNNGQGLLMCPPGAEWAFQTDLRSAKLGELDFSGAVIGKNAPKTAPVQVVFVYLFMCTEPPFAFREGLAVVMEDAEAVWMSATRGEKEWEKIKQAGEIEFTDSRLL
ncbi:hypothetical protein MSAN_00098100 [Mycena sanguinolenta]|uniref:Uncharacterized protein n=1 Tax=Mycena sanguinolenta TaxID=230812 RepID=A0A8H6ZG58_9AGAR|nr:hypothetical protein MSAN_00098100 [Mycena sanguinolenta]